MGRMEVRLGVIYSKVAVLVFVGCGLFILRFYFFTFFLGRLRLGELIISNWVGLGWVWIECLVGWLVDAVCRARESVYK